MSDSSPYDRWVAAGEPFQLAKPLATIRDLLRGYGYTVYDKGDDRHLHADPPEDHTPYSATGWPAASPFGWGFAIDVMPPAKAGLPSLAQLGAQLVADRKAGVAGVAWLKYINWEPDGLSGPCYQDRWQPTHARRDSSDRGHIHLSGRTDFQTSDVAADYDPVARVRSAIVATADEIAKAILETKIASDGLGVPAPGWPVKDWIKKGEDARQQVVKLTAKVDGLESVPQVDLDALADKVADRLAAKLALGFVPAPPPDGAS
jgi:hypothetical protein